jgi:hypothetical protein
MSNLLLMNSKATYFVKLAVPEVNGKPSMNLIQLERHHRYYMQRLKKPIVAILNFYHCFIKFRINELRIIPRSKILLTNPAPNT